MKFVLVHKDPDFQQIMKEIVTTRGHEAMVGDSGQFIRSNKSEICQSDGILVGNILKDGTRGEGVVNYFENKRRWGKPCALLLALLIYDANGFAKSYPRTSIIDIQILERGVEWFVDAIASGTYEPKFLEKHFPRIN